MVSGSLGVLPGYKFLHITKDLALDGATGSASVSQFVQRFVQTIIPEPAKHTQELYAALDSVVQAVLTDRNTDIESLLKGVDTQIQALVDADAK